MGVRERKLRDKEALREKIIAAATELFREESYAAVSMRKIAKRIEYSVGTLYLHYRDKDQLFLAVQEQAFERAFAYIRASAEQPTPLEQLYDLGHRYIDFGIRNPDLYRLMFMMEHPMEALDDSEGWRSGIKLHQLLMDIVRRCMEEGAFPGTDPNNMSFLLWSIVHGMVSLRVSHRLDIYTGDHLEDCPVYPNLDEKIETTYRMAMQLLSQTAGLPQPAADR